jgi:hypothetical protein
MLAITAAARFATMYNQRFDHAESPIILIPTATAGLNTAPEIEPTAKAPAITVLPIARP